MRQLTIFTAALGLLVSPPAFSDILFGVYAGTELWQTKSSGTFGNTNSTNANFDLNDDNSAVIYLSIEHPVPMVPNVRLRQSHLSTNANVSLNNFTFGGQTFNSNHEAEVTIKNVDLTLYYEILDNDLVSVDFGLTGKFLDGKASVDTTSENISGVIPMLYGSTKIGIPSTELSLFGEAHGLSFEDSKILDYQIGAEYKFVDNLVIDASLRAGFRDFSIKLDGFDDLNTDWTFKGPFVGIQAHF